MWSHTEKTLQQRIASHEKYGKYEIESVEFLNFHAGKKNPDNEFDEIVNPQELRNVQGLIWENLYTDILSLVERKKSEG